MPDALRVLILTAAGWVNRHQEDVIDYLWGENRVLREHLGPRPLRLTDAQRRRLAVRGQKLGRRILAQVYRLRVLGQWFDGIRFYAAAPSPRRSRRTWAGLR